MMMIITIITIVIIIIIIIIIIIELSLLGWLMGRAPDTRKNVP